MENIFSNTQLLRQLDCTKIDRSANFHAHNIAHWATTTSLTGSFTTNLYPLLDLPLNSGKDPP
jgi:hypothetical protein